MVEVRKCENAGGFYTLTPFHAFLTPRSPQFTRRSRPPRILLPRSQRCLRPPIYHQVRCNYTEETYDDYSTSKIDHTRIENYTTGTRRHGRPALGRWRTPIEDWARVEPEGSRRRGLSRVRKRRRSESRLRANQEVVPLRWNRVGPPAVLDSGTAACPPVQSQNPAPAGFFFSYDPSPRTEVLPGSITRRFSLFHRRTSRAPCREFAGISPAPSCSARHLRPRAPSTSHV